MVMLGQVLLCSCILLQRIAELRIAAVNRTWALAAGAKEYGGTHYPCFFILHSAWLMSWMYEGYWRNDLSPRWLLWFSIFIMAQGIRYWSINSLGRFWNTRILVIPGMMPVRRGPYQYLRHPNYLAVTMELVCVPLIFNAWITATVISLLNAALLLIIRIPAEEAALREATNKK